MSDSGSTTVAPLAQCLSGGGAMGQLMRDRDWSLTPLGPVELWPQSLRTSVSIVLESKFPMYVAWGADYIQLYNDGYRPILGATKHPQALGISTRETFPESWDIIGPMFDGVRAGIAVGAEDWMLPLDRYGYMEECYFTFSYSPIRDESEGVGGVLVTVSETTARVLGERRLEKLRVLAAMASQAKSESEIWSSSLEILCRDPADLAFCLAYRASGPDEFTLQGRFGIESGSTAAPLVLGRDCHKWPVARVLLEKQPVTVDDVLDRLGPTFGVRWPEPVRTALLVPIRKPGLENSYGLLIIGISPRRALDDQYRSFFSLMGDHVATGIANVRAYEEEKRRVEALAELDLAKTQFFSNVSHEFRTPLTLMLGPLEEMLFDPKGPAETVSALNLIHRNGLRLLRMVNSLLDFSRIEAGRIRASYVATDLSGFTEELASTFNSAMERVGLDFQVHCGPLSQPVWVDQEMWEKVVLNLLSNAFKFTFSGSVTVSLTERDDAAELLIADTGTGIPEHELPLVFERFHRVEGARGRTFEGTGIGLALVKELVRLHGGTIQVDSAMGQGSAFRIRLPFGTEHLPADRLNPPETRVSTAIRAAAFVQEALHWLPHGEGAFDVENIATPAPSEVEGQSVSETAGARVLVVDDNPDMRGYIRRLLSQANYEVQTASSGEEALRAVRKSRPELVLSDVMMPGLDGFGLLRALRSDPSTQAIPVVLLSARAGEEARAEGLDAGADDYLTKPFGARELLARVSAHLKLARVRRKAEDQARVILESITDGFFALDRDWRFTYVNSEGERLIGFRRDRMMGMSLWEAYPEAVGTEFYREYTRAMNQRIPVEFESFYPPLEAWFRVKAYPADSGGISVFYEDVTERKRAEEELRRANQDLEQFAYSASHDLQEPLRNVAVFSQLLHKRYSGQFDASGEEFLSRIVSGAQRTGDLLSDLLAYTRIGASDEEAIASVDSAAILREVLKDLAQTAADAGATVTFDELPVVHMRPRHLQQLLQNLIGNAIKYAKDSEAPRVQVSAVRDASMWRLTVADNGIGIAREYQQQIFGLFKRLHSNNGKYAGTGIGLAICQKIVDQYAGRIWVESELGCGSAFHFTLPGPSV